MRCLRPVTLALLVACAGNEPIADAPESPAPKATVALVSPHADEPSVFDDLDDARVVLMHVAAGLTFNPVDAAAFQQLLQLVQQQGTLPPGVLPNMLSSDAPPTVLPPGVLPSGLLPPALLPLGLSRPNGFTNVSLRGRWWVLDQHIVKDDARRRRVLALLRERSAFAIASDPSCFAGDRVFHLERTSGEPIDVVTDSQCGMVDSFGVYWPYKEHGLGARARAELAAIFDGVSFEPPPPMAKPPPLPPPPIPPLPPQQPFPDPPPMPSDPMLDMREE